MRFMGLRSLENQAALMRHKTREMLVSQRTQLLNGLRGHLTEIGIIAAQGPRHARELAALIEAGDEKFRLKCARLWRNSFIKCIVWMKRLCGSTERSRRWRER